MTAMERTRRLLVVRFSALGDVAMTLPAIYSLARQYPSLEIDVLTSPFMAQLFIGRPANVRVLTADFKGEYRGARGIVRLLRMLGQQRYDCVADLHNVLRSWWIDLYFRLLGRRVEMVDKQRVGRRAVLRGGESRQMNFVDRYAGVFARLGYPVRLDFRSLFAGEEPSTPIEVCHPAVGIAPFARYMTKIYPLEQMREVVRMLTGQGVHVYLFGGRGREAEVLGQWQRDCENCTSLAGRYKLSEELALMSRMDAMVSMDSANQHMASLVGAKVLSLWGGTTPACGFAPYGQSPESSLWLGLPCQPCSIAGGKSCPEGHFRCMRDLAPEHIVQKIKELINR